MSVLTQPLSGRDFLRLLLVEDDDGDAELTAYALRGSRLRLEIDRATSVAEAGSKAGVAGYDAILLDLNLPDSEGLETLQRLVPEAGSAAIVVMTGHHDEGLGRRAIAAGAQDYIEKQEFGARDIERCLRYAIERSAHEATRQKNIETLRVVVDVCPCALLLLNSNGEVEMANPAAEAMFGGAAGGVIGVPLEFLIPDLLSMSDDRPIGKGRDMTAHRLDGTSFLVDVGLNVIGSGGGHSALCVVVDVTERKREEEARQQRQRLEALGRLSGGVAHDFNNLLTLIMNYAEAALLSVQDSVAVHALNNVVSATQRASELTQQLLTVGQKSAAEREAVDINSALQEAVQMLMPTMGRAITVKLTLAPDAPAVLVDRAQLNQVIANFLVNARDAIVGGGTITIMTRVPPSAALPDVLQHDRYVAMTVQDTGDGIPADIQNRIFEPFFTTKSPGDGTGLGLAIVYGIVQQHAGHIEVQTQDGQGTAFTVYWEAVGPTRKILEAGDAEG